MDDIKTTQKDLRELACKLAQQGLCNVQPMGSKEWFAKRDRQDYTRIAYAKSNYGTVAELYYMKEDKEFCYV